MALLTASGSFVIAGGEATGLRAITGLGFQPKLVIIHGTLGRSGGGYGAWAVFGAAAAAENYSVGTDTRNNTGYEAGARYSRNNLLWISDTGSLPHNVFNLASFDADGFTINKTTTHWSNTPHYWTAFGGDIEAKIGMFMLSSTVGHQAVTGIGFEGKLALFAATHPLHNTGIWSGFTYSMGAAAGPSQRFAATMWSFSAGGGFTDAKRKSTASRCLYTPGAGAEADFVSFDSDGFTLDVKTAGSFAILYAVIGGDVEAAVGSLSQPTSLGTQAISGLGIAPEYLMTFGAGNTALDTVEDHSPFTVGVASSPSQQQALGHWNSDNANPSLVRTFGTSAKCVGFQEAAGSIVAEAELDSFDADGFTLDWTTVDATARRFGFIALAAGGAPTPFPIAADLTLPAGWLGAAGRGGALPAESLARLERHGALPASRLALVIGGAELPAEQLGALAELMAAPAAWQGAVARRGDLPAEWRGTLLIAADGVLPSGWLGLASRDGGAAVGWGAGLARGADLPAEGLGAADRRAAAPTAWQGGVSSRAALPAAWAGTVVVAIDRDAGLPVEFLGAPARAAGLPVDWAGTLTIAADGAAPAEWRALLQRAAAAPAEALTRAGVAATAPAEQLGGAGRAGGAPAAWSGALIVHADPPAEWTAGLELDRAAVADWLATVAPASAALPAGWTAIVAAGGSLPAEWDGALLLAPRGRLLVARGDVVRVIGARVILHPAGTVPVRKLH